jgi:hypothetical protein
LLDETAFVVMVEQVALVLGQREIADRRTTALVHPDADHAVVEVFPGRRGGLRSKSGGQQAEDDKRQFHGWKSGESL